MTGLRSLAAGPKARRLALLASLAGATWSAFATGCATPDEDADQSTDRFTLANGSQFIVSVTTDNRDEKAKASTTVVLETSTGDCSACDLLTSLQQDSNNKVKSLEDLKGKAILIHPVEGKAEEGAFMTVDQLQRSGTRLTLTGPPIGIDQIATLAEDDIVRVFMDRNMPRGDGSAKRGRTQTSTQNFGLLPQEFGAANSVRPAGFGGVLAGDAPTFIVWNGVAPSVDFIGVLKPTVTDMSFRPEVLLDWQKGRGLEVGLQMDMDLTAGLEINGILGAKQRIFKMSVESPNVFLLAPGGLALPFNLTFSASFGCDAVGGGKINFKYSNPLNVHVGGSANIRPDWTEPASEWVSTGRWPFEVTGDSKSNVEKLELEPSVGLLCTVRVGANFSPKWFPVGGLYIKVEPSMFMGVGMTRPSYSVGLLAGAWTAKPSASAEVFLLRWTP